MSRTASFDYFYGMQAEAYSFYRIPKVLFTDPFFKKLSCEAKVLYGLMLDRISLSVKNRWFDEQDRVYIIFTIEDVRKMLGCCRQTAVNLMAELDTQKGIGLIEKKRLGLGKANIIYVKNFLLREDVPGTAGSPHSSQKSKKQTSAIPESRNQDVQETDFCNSTPHTSGSLEERLPEVCESDGNNNDPNKTDFNETEWNQIKSHPSAGKDPSGSDDEEMEIYRAYQELIKENIEYEILIQDHRQEEVDGIVSLMTDAVCSTRKKIIIAGEPVLQEVVKSRLLKLGHEHIEYVFLCMRRNTTKVRNIKQYLLTSLYNAPATIGHYYTAEVNHDLYGSWSDLEE